jgi:hypothetical protein
MILKDGGKSYLVNALGNEIQPDVSLEDYSQMSLRLLLLFS